MLTILSRVLLSHKPKLICKKWLWLGTSLVVQLLRLYTPDAGGWVQSLVGELDPTCHNQDREHFKNNFIYLFIWLCWVFIADGLFPSCGEQEPLPTCRLLIVVATLVIEHRLWGMRASGFAVHGLSSCSFQALEHRLNSCGARAYLLLGMWDLLRRGIEPISPELAGGFFTTEPPEKPWCIFYV